MRRAIVVLFAIAGCSATDPCAGRAGTCIALTVQGSASGIDALAVTVDQPTTKTETTASMSLALPVTLGLNLPASVAGVVHIAVQATSHGTTVARGSTQATVSHNRGTATVTLGSPAIVLDLSARDLSARDLANSDGPPSESDGFTANVPGAPANVIASSGNAQATVAWSAPASPGSSPITSYTVTSSPGGIKITTADGNTTTATIAGLTNGTAYTFSVVATNLAGSGPAATSNAVTPTATPMVPAAPSLVGAVADVDHGAHVSWTAADNRGSTISRYTVVVAPGGTQMVTPDGTTTSLKWTGLTPGSMYTFTVTATNGVGTSLASSPSSAITVATLPGAPTAVMASANGSGGATVTWTAPGANGFSAITKYTVTASPGGATATTPDGTTTTAQVTGLTTGMPYTFTVVAANVIGNGPASSASPSLTLPMHDTLVVLTTNLSTSGTIDFYDGYNSLADGTSTPSRSVSLGFAPENGGLAIDAVNAVVYVVASSSVAPPSRVYGWLHADTLNGAAPTPDITLATSGNGPIAVDAAHKKLYVTVGCSGDKLSLERYGYTTPTDVSSAAVEATFTVSGGCGREVSVNPANGDIWFASSPSGGDGGFCLLPAAYNLASGSACAKLLTIMPQSGTLHGYAGAVYTPANGGTIYLADTQQNSIDWLANVDALASGNYTATGNLFGLSSVGNVALDGARLLLASGPGVATTVQAWNLSSLSGRSVKTVSSAHASVAGMLYVP